MWCGLEDEGRRQEIPDLSTIYISPCFLQYSNGTADLVQGRSPPPGEGFLFHPRHGRSGSFERLFFLSLPGLCSL